MTDPESAQMAWESQGQQAVLDMGVFDAKISLAIQEALRDGLAPWALYDMLTLRAKPLGNK